MSDVGADAPNQPLAEAPDWLFVALIRSFATCVAAMLGVGLVFDVFRFACGWDIVGEADQQRVAQAMADPATARRYKTWAVAGFWLAMLPWFALGIFFAGLSPSHSYSNDWPRWPQDVLAWFSCCANNARRFPATLIAHGFADRAHVAAQYYEAALLLFPPAFAVGLARSQVIGDLVQMRERRSRILADKGRVQGLGNGALRSAGFAVGSYVVAKNVLGIDWTHSRSSWDLAQSGHGFFIYVWFILTSQVRFRMTYVMLVGARLPLSATAPRRR